MPVVLYANPQIKDTYPSWDTLVEAGGVEPPSENPSTGLSTSVVGVLEFPPRSPRQQGQRLGSFINPTCRKAQAGWFPTMMTPGYRPWASGAERSLLKQRRERNYRSLLLFKFPVITQSGPAARLSHFRDPRRNQFRPHEDPQCGKKRRVSSPPLILYVIFAFQSNKCRMSSVAK